MTRKTESLSYPSNPLAAMRELQELDAKPHGIDVNGAAPEPTKVALPASSAVASADSSEEARATSSEVASATRSKKPRPKPGRRARGGEPDSSEEPSPLASAVREMLSEPYTADPKKGPFTVSTVKIPTEVSERLGWVSTLTGKAKQEILAEALKDYFQKILNGR